MEILSSDECRTLLATRGVGRLAVMIGGYPQAFPVNYAVVRDRILIRTAPGSKLSHARFKRVGFEIDEFDAAQRTGWSVLVKGVLHELTPGDHHAEEFRVVAARIDPWPAGEKPHVLVITPVTITGRRLLTLPGGTHRAAG